MNIIAMFKKFIVKHFYIHKTIMYEGRYYYVIDVYPNNILVETPNFSMKISNDQIAKIQFVKVNTSSHHISEKVVYYDQQTDEMKTGTIFKIEKDGTVQLLDGDITHINLINIPKKSMRRYKKGCLFKHDGKWYTIDNCFLTDQGLAYNCTGYDLLGHVFTEKEIIKFNKES